MAGGSLYTTSSLRDAASARHLNQARRRLKVRGEMPRMHPLPADYSPLFIVDARGNRAANLTRRRPENDTVREEFMPTTAKGRLTQPLVRENGGHRPPPGMKLWTALPGPSARRF